MGAAEFAATSTENRRQPQNSIITGLPFTGFLLCQLLLGPWIIPEYATATPTRQNDR